MARDDEEREIQDPTIIAGKRQTWSPVDQPGSDPLQADESAAPDVMHVGAPEDAVGSPVGPDSEGAEPSPEGLAVRTSDPKEEPTDAEKPTLDDESTPVLKAKSLSLLSKSGWVFKDIDLTLPPASVAAIVGPSGTGRSCLLLSLSGRMDTDAGTLMVAGHSMRDKPSAIRAVTSVARIGTLVAPEPTLTVKESVTERCLLEDVDTRIGRTRYEEACAALQYTAEPAALVASLIGEQATLFALALACVRVSAVIVLDDLDRGISAAKQQTILDALIRLSRTGPTVVLSTTDRIPVMEADVVLDLTPQDAAMIWRSEPAASGPGMLEQLEPGGNQRSPVPPELRAGPLPPESEPGRAGDRNPRSDVPTEDL